MPYPAKKLSVITNIARSTILDNSVPSRSDIYFRYEPKAIPHNSRLTAQAPLRRLRHGICVAKMLDKTSSIICAFGLASAAPRSPYRHLELCGIALNVICRGRCLHRPGCRALPDILLRDTGKHSAGTLCLLRPPSTFASFLS